MTWNDRRGAMVKLVPVIAACLVLAACGSAGQSEGGGEGGSITLWDEFTAGDALAMKDIIRTWEDRGGAKVQERTIGNEDFFTALRTGLASNNPPDVVQYEGYQQTRDFAKADRLEDITDIWNKVKDNFALPEVAERACSYEGRYYCIPIGFSRITLYSNDELLSKHGIARPTTFEEFLAAGEKLKAAGVTPVALGSRDGWPGSHWWMGLATQRCGADTVNKAINRQGPKWNDPCFQQASADLAGMAERGFFSKGVLSGDYGAMTAEFLGGKAGFMLTGTWFVSSWLETPASFDVGLSSFPVFPGAPGADDIVGGSLTDLGVPKRGKNKEEARRFVEFMGTKEAATLWASRNSVSLVKGAVEASKAPKALKDAWAASQEAPGVVNFFEIELPPAVGEDVVYNGTTAVAAGKLDPEEFTDELESTAESVQGSPNG